jgi:hypothetical protein
MLLFNDRVKGRSATQCLSKQERELETRRRIGRIVRKHENA